MKKIILFASLLLLGACQSGSDVTSDTTTKPDSNASNTSPTMISTAPNTSLQFSSKMTADDETLIDTQNKIEWVNDPEGCFAGVIDQKDYLTAKNQ